MQEGSKVMEREGFHTGMMTLLRLLKSVHGRTHQRKREVGWVFLDKDPSSHLQRVPENLSPSQCPLVLCAAPASEKQSSAEISSGLCLSQFNCATKWGAEG